MAWTSPEFERFSALARQYCGFIDNAQSHSLPERLLTISVLLADLYASMLYLADSISNNEPSAEAGPASSGVVPPWPGLEDLTLYWEVTDPYEWGPPISGSLSDDLLAIYGNLRRGLAILDSSGLNAAQDAAAEWHRHFEASWGEHIVDALHVLHRARYRHRTGQ